MMRCLSCKYDLANLTEPRCPECGRVFDPSDGMTFGPRKIPFFDTQLKGGLWGLFVGSTFALVQVLLLPYLFQDLPFPVYASILVLCALPFFLGPYFIYLYWKHKHPET